MLTGQNIGKEILSLTQIRAERGAGWVYGWLLGAMLVLFGSVFVMQLQMILGLVPQHGYPYWSPDGQQVAFSKGGSSDFGPSDIYVINRNGIGLRNLTKNQGQRMDISPNWSPNGRQISFWSDAEDIHVISVDGNGLNNLTRELKVAVSPGGWSPDGSQVFFRSATGYQDSIYVMSADGSNLRNLTPDLMGHTSSVALSPNGRQIVFTYHSEDEPDNIYVMNADGSDLKKLTNAGNLVGDAYAVWSPDGKRIAIWSENGVHVVNNDGSDLKELTSFPIESVVWSPDGKQIVGSFKSDYRNDVFRSGKLYMINANGGDLKTLASLNGALSGLDWAWSPDGQQIAYSFYGGGNGEIRVMNVNGSGVQMLVRLPGNVALSDWSPDGQQIAFRSWQLCPSTFYFPCHGDDAIYAINADGTNLRNLSRLFSMHMPWIILVVVAHVVPLVNLRSPYFYVRRHAQQVAILIGLNILVILMFIWLIEPIRLGNLFVCGWIIVHSFLWFLATSRGLRQVKRGESWLMRRMGEEKELPRPWDAPA